MKLRSIAIAVCWSWISSLCLADILEVKKDANFYAEPDRQSKIVHHIELNDDLGIYTVLLLESKTTKGYYKVKLRGRDEVGWIYKSYARRYSNGVHPKKIPYERKLYRHWIDENRDCLDTRNEVLRRDARPGSIKLDEKGCSVQRGSWLDPYTGKTFSDPSELDIDHFVPLKNAHESGAWAWSPARKRLYANYLDDKFHLLAVKNSENRSKSDKGPDLYMPPNKRFHCDYIRIWTSIKEDWELEMSGNESAAVVSLQKTCESPRIQ